MMFCKNCGKELPDGTNFCPVCGEKVKEEPENSSNSQQTSQGPTTIAGNPKIISFLIALVPVLVLAFIAFFLYARIGINGKADKLAAQIDEAAVSSYIDEKNTIMEEWNTLGFLNLSEKKKLLEELEGIQSEIGDFDSCSMEIEKLFSEKEQYHLEDSTYNAYEETLGTCQQTLDGKDLESARQSLETAKKALEDLKASNDVYVEQALEEYEAADLSSAAEAEVTQYNSSMDELKQLSQEENKDYSKIKQLFSELDETIYLYLEPEKDLDISVQQVDATEFPKVKLYLSVKDRATQEVLSFRSSIHKAVDWLC